MRLLYLCDGDLVNKHELGFIAALTDIGRVDVIDLSFNKEKVIKVRSDNGIKDINIYRVTTLKTNISSYDAIFATPRRPILEILKYVIRGVRISPIVLRLWSIRAAKLRDNLRFGAYEDIPLFMPSVIANAIYVGLSNYVLTVDHATYAFAKRIYGPLASRVYKLYPPYGYILTNESNPMDKEVMARLSDIRDPYILGFTSLNKEGAYLKFEAKPHAVILYKIAKRLKEVPVVMAGSTMSDWKRVFPNIEPPKNLHLIGRGFSDNILSDLYRKAKMVIIPITNRNISNRLLEALFFSKPIITSEVAQMIHPELKHGKHLYISNWNHIVDDAVRIIFREDLLEELAEGAKEAYRRMFLTRINAAFVRSILNL